MFYLSVKLKGFGWVGCHLFGLRAGKLLVSIFISWSSLSKLSPFFDSLSELHVLFVERIFWLRRLFSTSWFLHLQAKHSLLSYFPTFSIIMTLKIFFRETSIASTVGRVTRKHLYYKLHFIPKGLITEASCFQVTQLFLI
jgi:hypothetical protein